MRTDLNIYKPVSFQTERGYTATEDVFLSYEVHGQPLDSGCPVVIVFHALTGNSDVCSMGKGWWKELINYGKCIDLDHYTVIAFNIPGNGYDGQLIETYHQFLPIDIVRLAYAALVDLGITQVHSIVGGSLGGGIAWEMALAYPDFTQHLIAVATHWQSQDWLIGMAGVQEDILLNSSHPLADARKMAMFFYRTPLSLADKFKREKRADGVWQVTSWLDHHGRKLTGRFARAAYLMMNHLMREVNVFRNEDEQSVLNRANFKVIQISVTTDLLYEPEVNRTTKTKLDEYGINNELHEIDSDDGHDAFLIETENISKILLPIYKS